MQLLSPLRRDDREPVQLWLNQFIIAVCRDFRGKKGKKEQSFYSVLSNVAQLRKEG